MLTTLMAQREFVNKVPTWPWSTSALTGFLWAVLLPVALFLIRRYLSEFLAGGRCPSTGEFLAA